MQKLRFFFIGLAGYIHIILFPVLISLIVSLIVYLTMPAAIGLLLSLFLCFCGLIVGLIMALRVLKERGASAFVPETDSEDEVVGSEFPQND